MDAWLVRASRGGMHPLLHVLMDVFLDAQPAAPPNVNPFGAGPWPCLNPLASHKGQAVITNFSSYTTKGRLVARFACTCGYVYSHSLDPSGVRTAPRYYRYGPLLEPELLRQIRAGASLRAISRALGIDPSTVFAEASKLGLPVPWRARPNERQRPTREVVARLVFSGNGAGLSPMPSPRQDWRARDAETLVSCRRAVAALTALEPPSRLTFAAIERAAVGRTGWVRSRSARLPRTVSFIRRAVETTSAFQRRRAAFAVNRTDGHVLPWRVMRAAGLTGAALPMIRELIEGKLPTVVRVAA